jgi:hypothetical protein
MNSQQLSSQSQDLQARAVSDRREAERFTLNAETYRKNGDETRAAVDEDRAQRLVAEAEGYESEADQLAQASLAQDARAQQLESEKQQVKSEYESKIAAIENEQQKLRGGGGGLF